MGFPGQLVVIACLAVLGIAAGLYYLGIPVPHPFGGEVRNHFEFFDTYQTSFPWQSSVTFNWSTNDHSTVWFFLICGFGITVYQANASSGSDSFNAYDYSSSSSTPSLLCDFSAIGGNGNGTILAISGTYASPRVSV